MNEPSKTRFGAWFRSGGDGRLVGSFILSLLFDSSPRPGTTNPNTPGELDGFDDESLRLLVDEGRRQIDSQAVRYRHTTDRAQVLVTISLIAIPFWVGVYQLTTKTKGWEHAVSGALWALGGLGILAGLAAAAAVIVAKASFAQIDTTQVSGWKPPVLKGLAADYASAVRMGEVTVADRVTVFRQATRFLIWGVVFTTASVLVAV